MTVIGIDTASRLGGVAVVSDGRLLGAHTLGVEEGHSENLLPCLQGLMHSLGLAADDVQGIAVAIGPGSYTGLRIGVAVAKGLGYAWNVPVRGVSTLLALAWALKGADGVICASLDARKGHVFSAMYSGRSLADATGGFSEALLDSEDRRGVEQVAEAIHDRLAQGDDVYLVGDGAPAVREAVERSSGTPAPAVSAVSPENGPDGQRGERRKPSDGPRVIVVPLWGEAMRAASVAHIGEIEFSRGEKDDLFALSPNYLRRSEAERRWRQSP